MADDYSGKYLDGNGVSHLWAKIKATFALISHTHTKSQITDFPTIPGASSTTPKMDGTAAVGSETAWAKGDHVHPTDTSRAAASHAHGNITSGGDITATAPTVASGDKLIINDESASKITNGPSFGTDTTKYLRNDGSWAVPPGTTTDTDTTYTLGTTGTGSTRKVTLTAGGSGSGTQSVSVPDTLYGDFTGASSSEDGTAGLVPMPGAGEQYSVLLGNADFVDLAELIQVVSGDTKGFVYVPQTGSVELDDSGTLMTSAQSTKLAGIATGAEVNQNAFSRVVVGSTNIDADTKTDALTLVAGSNITITPDATNDKVTIAATDTDTKNTAGSIDSSSKLFLIGATAQDANPQTFSQDTAYVGTDGHLYSNSKQAVNLSDTQALTNKTYNGYTLGAACELSIGGVAYGNNGVVQGGAVYQAIQNAMSSVAGALKYQGTVGTGGTVTDLPASHTKGWYYVVVTAGTYAGKTCEVGDMLICNATGTTATDSHWDAVQSNITALTTTEIDAIVAAA